MTNKHITVWTLLLKNNVCKELQPFTILNLVHTSMNYLPKQTKSKSLADVENVKVEVVLSVTQALKFR